MAERRSISSKERGFLFALDLCRCRYCGVWQFPWTKPTPHIDHCTALANGGADNITNYTLSCQDCNLRKGTKVWTPRRRGIVNYIVAIIYFVVMTAVNQSRKSYK